MKPTIVRPGVAVLFGALAMGAEATPAASQDQPVLVSTEWLADRIDDPDLVLVHVGMSMRGMPDEYIEGARFIEYHDFADDRDGLVIQVMPEDQMVEAIRNAGISNDSRVVLYGAGSAHMPARIYMTLDYLGHGDRTSVLDGGIETWKAEGRPMTGSVVTPHVGTFEPHINDDVLVSAEWIAERLDDPAMTLIDARPENEYTGERTPQTLRPGHIPGAYNLYWADLMKSDDEPVLKALAEVQARWDEAGADRDGLVVSYCYIGMRASYTYLISKHLGYDARFYDGSWNEWGADQSLPVVEGLSRR